MYPLEQKPIPRPAYTHKSVALKAKGVFYVNGKAINLDNGLGCSDWYVINENKKFSDAINKIK
jgi:hypothetical protein